MKAATVATAVTAAAVLLATGCNNNPWPEGESAANTLRFAAIESSPRHLDPTASYWNNETPYTYQIYEPLYGFHYLKRPFELVPKLAASVVEPRYVDRDGRSLPADAPAEQVAESIYDVPIRPGVVYQPHPAFARDGSGDHRYHRMEPGELGRRRTPLDFEHTGTREVVAEDFVYALKRHATPRITAPLYSTFARVLVGLDDYGPLIQQQDALLRQGLDASSRDKPFLDFRRWPLAGATAPAKHLLRMRIKGKYPQWRYWMQMTFMAPVPWEADAFYAQPGMAERALTLDTWPVGTGPYMLVESIKDRRHTLRRNPNFRLETYPCDGMPGDREAGLLDDCGKRLPFIDTLVSTVEREAVPRQGKFRQGHYDIEVFERTDTGMDYLVGMQDSEDVRREYLEKGFRLKRGLEVNSYYIAFNMLDPVVGAGDTPEQQRRNRKLRQAISIAVDWDRYSKIFPRKAGTTAMSPLPPGIFGSREETLAGVNPVTHRVIDGRVERRPLAEARQLMADAGYPGGRDAVTGKPLVLNYDVYYPPTPERKPEIDWVVRQFATIDIQIEVRATDNNQFQDKVRKGNYQVFWSGWNADYPDAENFMFLLTTSAGKTRFDGENLANYANPTFDRLFDRMKVLPDGAEKQRLLDEMVALVREDAPWTMGYFPDASAAAQRWVHNFKPALLVRDHARYLRLDVADRQAAFDRWNEPVWWPIGLSGAGGLIGAALVRRRWLRHESTGARGRVSA